MQNNTWLFVPESGGGDGIALAGYAAPFGRPRQKEVYTEKYKHRINTKYYPGNDIPTRHFFGNMFAEEGIVLSGRWMDKFLNGITAREIVDKFQRMVSEKKLITMSWGSFISFNGYVESIEAKWESQQECAWTLTFLVNESATLSNIRRPRRPPPLTGQLMELEAAEEKRAKLLPAVETSIQFDLLDLLGILFSKVAEITSSVLRIAMQLQAVEERLSSTISRLLSSVNQLRTALVILQDTVDQVSVDAAMLRDQGNALADRAGLAGKPTTAATMAWVDFQLNNDALTMETLAILADIALNLTIMQNGIKTTSYMAKTGDTWESISTQFFNTAAKADQIRKANSIRYGQMPGSGVVYTIPA